ncbi:MAG: GNAT family N-acetyltransferase [Actinocatenispora sp.]
MSTPDPTPPPDTFRTDTERGVFALRPVDVAADLPLVHDWMHQPHVVPYWQQDWPAERLRGYLLDQFAGDASRPCLGLLAGEPVSYWEVYRPVRDPLGDAYPARPTDLGVHLLIGRRDLTGSGLGTVLLRAVRDGLWQADPACDRIVAEPDVRNVPSVRAFGKAGFHRHDDIDLPGKTAALMIAERSS